MERGHAGFLFFFFNDTATTEIYTLSLHDALPISPKLAESRYTLVAAGRARSPPRAIPAKAASAPIVPGRSIRDRKSTRLNSSHSQISYAVFCLKKNKHVHHVRSRSTLHTATDQLD